MLKAKIACPDNYTANYCNEDEIYIKDTWHLGRLGTEKEEGSLNFNAHLELESARRQEPVWKMAKEVPMSCEISTLGPFGAILEYKFPNRTLTVRVRASHLEDEVDHEARAVRLENIDQNLLAVARQTPRPRGILIGPVY